VLVRRASRADALPGRSHNARKRLIHHD